MRLHQRYITWEGITYKRIIQCKDKRVCCLRWKQNRSVSQWIWKVRMLKRLQIIWLYWFGWFLQTIKLRVQNTGMDFFLLPFFFFHYSDTKEIDMVFQIFRESNSRLVTMKCLLRINGGNTLLEYGAGENIYGQPVSTNWKWINGRPFPNCPQNMPQRGVSACALNHKYVGESRKNVISPKHISERWEVGQSITKKLVFSYRTVFFILFGGSVQTTMGNGGFLLNWTEWFICFQVVQTQQNW